MTRPAGDAAPDAASALGARGAHRPPTLLGKVAAEAIGTGLLVCAVVGSGIAAARLSPDDLGLQLLENSIATGAALVALILALQPVSAAFNPAVTLVERLLGSLDTRTAATLVGAQLVGGAGGAVLANLMFDLPAVTVSTHERGGTGQLLAEVVATFGLVLLILATVRAGRAAAVPYVVGGWITAAYWFTSSTSFANPAVTLARTLSDTFAGIAPSSAPAFVAMQLVGAVLALATLIVLHPHRPAPPDQEYRP